MDKTIIEVIKENKKAIIKKTLIIGGTIVGLSLVARNMLKNNDEVDDVIEDDFNEVEETESSEE